MIFFPLFIVIIAMIFYIYSSVFPSHEDITCHHMDIIPVQSSDDLTRYGECFFQDSYEDSRKQFIELSQRCNASMFELPVTDNLITDVSIIHGSEDSYLIHISGTHGVEGFAGSGIQAAMLYILSQNPAKYTGPTLVFVHALNPYGFAHKRRFNEENIDLNRNFMTDAQFEGVKKRDPDFAGYIKLSDYFNPPFKPHDLNVLNYIQTSFNLLVSYVKHSPAYVKAALISGNYHTPKGLFFGGEGRTKSIANLLSFLFNNSEITGLNFDGIKKMVMIDVHTGLGPIGVDTFLPHLGDSNSAEVIEAVFPTEYASGSSRTETGAIKPWLSANAKAVDAGYEFSTGFSTEYFGTEVRPDLNSSSRVNIVQEFGTYPAVLVGMGLVLENQAFQYGTLEQREFYGNRLKNLFYVKNKKWTRSVSRRGVTVIQQAMRFLES